MDDVVLEIERILYIDLFCRQNNQETELWCHVDIVDKRSIYEDEQLRIIEIEGITTESTILVVYLSLESLVKYGDILFLGFLSLYCNWQIIQGFWLANTRDICSTCSLCDILLNHIVYMQIHELELFGLSLLYDNDDVAFELELATVEFEQLLVR